MFIQDADGVFEFFRGALPFYVILFVPLFIVISPMTPVFGAQEFVIYRSHHYDLHGTPHGCRSAAVNVEACTVKAGVYTRRCVLAKILDLTPEKYQSILSQNAGGLLVLIPSDMSLLTKDELEHITRLEKVMLKDEVTIPVYFTEATTEMEEIYDNVQLSSSNERAGSAFTELSGSLTATGYKLVGSQTQTKSRTDIYVSNIQGKLSGFGVEEQLPTVAIVAHYDSFGIAPSLSLGADSNGSGVAALLELARLMSRLYTSSRTHPRFNILFLLSGAGKFNYLGTKKWIEDNVDSSEGSLLPDAEYTICLDSLGSKNDLFMHVSKPPKDGSSSGNFWKELQLVKNKFHPELSLNMIHKKINLADDVLAWEHERFSIRRLPAFTLSSFQSPKDLKRNTITDIGKKLSISTLARNVKIIAEALARHVYNLTESDQTEIFSDGLSVREDFLKAWTDMLSSQPRSAQIISTTSRHPLLLALEQSLGHYLKDVKITSLKPDKREPEIVFYDPVSATMNAYKVKPAVFELFLAFVIAAYIGVVYLLILNFPKFEKLLKTFISSEKNHHS